MRATLPDTPWGINGAARPDAAPWKNGADGGAIAPARPHGGPDEYDLDQLRRDHEPVDAAGVGTKLGVSADAPSLDSAYELVAYGNRPVRKLSTGKATLPGPKQLWRVTRDLASTDT